MRSGLLAFALFVAAGIAVAAITAGTDRRSVAFSVGLPAVRVAATIEPGGERCRRGIDVPAAFARVRLPVATFGRPGPELAISLRDAPSGRVLATADVPAGYADNSTVQARVAAVRAGATVDVCVRDAGAAPVALLGAPPATLAGELDDPELAAEPAVVFERAAPATVLGETPAIVRRAARFKPGWAGPWLYWLALAGIVVGLPLLLAGAIRAAYASDRS